MTKKFILRCRLIILGFTASAVAILLIPCINILHEKVQGVLGYVVASMFWLGIILGIVMTFLADSLGRQIRQKIPRLRSKNTQRYPGIINFEIDTEQIVVYAVFVLGLAMIVCDVLGVLFLQITDSVMFAVIAVTYYSFLIHCLIDGKNYKIYKFLKKGNRNGSEK